MLKWLVGILLLLNLAIFVWYQPRQPAEQEPGALQLPGLGQINIYQEIENFPELEVIVEPVVESSEPVLSDQQPPKQEEDTIEIEEKAEEKPKTWVCGESSPVYEISRVQKVFNRMKSAGIGVEQKARSSQLVTGYRVLIGPLSNENEAKAMVISLKAEGITDIWLFPDGELKNAISLGLFSYKINAERRASRVRSYGYKVKIREKLESRKMLYLAFKAEGPPLVHLPETD